MDAYTMVRIRTRLSTIEGLRAGIEKEKVAYKNCMRRRKSAEKCRHHIKDIKWAKKEIEELRDQVKVLHSQIGD